MVLIGRHEALAALRDDRALDALIVALFEPDAPIASPERISQTDDAVVAIMSALREDTEDRFQDAVSLLNRRKIDIDADWIHDDLLVFSVIVGNLRFGGSDELVERLLRFRLSGAEGRSQEMSLSLKALAERKSDAPILPVLVVGESLVDPSRGWDGPLLSRAFGQASELEAEGDALPFLRLLGEKVADAATRIGVENHASEYSDLASFHSRFDLRAKCFAYVVFWVLFIGSAIGWFFVAGLFFSSDEESEELAGKLFDMGVVIGPVVVFFARKVIFSSSRRFFYRMLGGGILLDRERQEMRLEGGEDTDD